MILADTSVWIEHFRRGHPVIEQEAEFVYLHPFIIGELACGNLKNRQDVLEDLGRLPQAVQASEEEVMHLLADNDLWGRGVGWVDLHLLASALLSHCELLTQDKRLQQLAREFGIAYQRRG